MTCWRRLAAWNEAGVWDQLHQLLLNELRSKGRLDWKRALIDSSHVRAARRGPKSGPSPVDRARSGGKHHLIVDGQGIPRAVSLTGGNRNDVTQLLPLLDKIPPVAARSAGPAGGRTLCWPTAATTTTSTGACSGSAASGP